MRPTLSLFPRLKLAALAATLPLAPPAAADVSIPRAFVESSPAAAPIAASAGGRWWTIFGDAQLNALIERGMARNSDIATAAARLSLARAAMKGAEAERAPRIDTIAGVAQQSGPLINAAGGTGTLLQFGPRASWEVDLFGRAGKTARAARLDASAAASLLEGARLAAQADIAQAYFSLRDIEAERRLVDEAAAQARDKLAIEQRRQADGSGTALAVERLRGELDSILADGEALDRQHSTLLHGLALLVGETGSLELAPAAADGAPPVIPAGLPSEMLKRRPDIAAGLDTVEATRLRAKAARAAWFPSISLTGNGGLVSTGLAELVRSTAQTFGLNLLMSLPIFDGGRRAAARKRADAELELAEAHQRETLLRAFREVEDQLSGLRSLAGEEGRVQQVVEADAHAREIAIRRYDAGAISRIELIDIRRQGLAARRRAVQLHYARYGATIALVRALGGGWSAEPFAAAAPTAIAASQP